MSIINRIKDFIRVYKWAHMAYLEDSYNKNKELYWDDLHCTYNDLRAVGPSKDEEVNKKVYDESMKSLYAFLSSLDIGNDSIPNKHILEIGVGNGFFTSALLYLKPKKYQGMDISLKAIEKTASLLETLKVSPTIISLVLGNISNSDSITELYDYIFMLDVIQHITNKDDFYKALTNVKSHLAPKGTFVVTSYLSEPEGKSHESFHVKYWKTGAFEEIFPEILYDYSFYPKEYNSKQLFAIKER